MRNLFKRQLSIPLTDLKSTLVAYKAWESDLASLNDVNNRESDDLPSHVASVYQKALEMLNDRAHLEEKISKNSADSEKLQDFMVLSLCNSLFCLSEENNIFYKQKEDSPTI